MIGINACTLRGQGSSNVGKGVIQGMGSILGNESIEVWVPDSWKEQVHLPRKTHYSASGFIGKLRAENVDIRKSIQRGEIKRLLSLTDTSTPYTKIPHLLMVQQAFLAYPRTCWPRSGRAFRVRMALMERYFALGLRSVDMFTVQTKTMKNSLASKWRIAEDRVQVVPSAVEVPNGSLKFWQPGTESTDYLCYLATPSPQKNMWILPEIMAELKRRDLNLAMHLTVSRDDVPELVGRAKKLGVLDVFQFRGLLSRDAAFELLAGARATVMPTTLESFGLPFYEAMAAGCPVIAADTDFAREALGDAGMYAPLHNISLFADAAEEILLSDDLRRDLSTKGRARYRASKLTWNDVSHRYVELLNSI